MMRPQRKPKKLDSTSKLVLQEIIGLTTRNANGLSSNMQTGDCVYLAGCVVIVYNVELETQSHLMVSSRMPKPLNCVAVSNQDGGIIAAGESGHQPAVLVWNYASQTLLAELKVHRYGVTCIAFSHDGKHLVSVGFPHDGYLCLWDWRNGGLVTKLKSSSSCSVISSISFSSDAKVFVTAGRKHMKFWTVGSSVNMGAGLPAIDGKSANLGCQKGSSFISIASSILIPPITGRDRTAESFPMYALTDTGVLCLLGSGFSIRKWVDLKVEKGFSMSVSDTLIACGCNNGVVQLFASETLSFSVSLQISEPKEKHNSRDEAGGTRSSDKHFQSDQVIPDAVACQFATFEKLVVIYSDHSLCVWDVGDVAKVSKCTVLVSHSACIWDVKNLSCENMHDPTLACVARGCCGGVSFATCSTDGTIRLWDLALRFELKKKNDRIEATIGERFDGNSTGIEKVALVSAGIFERDIVESGVSTTQGFRSMAVSSDGKYLAAGDSHGNLHVYNLQTTDYICVQDAHEAEILSLTFSLPSKNNSCSGRYLLASGGRDRMIHLYDVERNFELIESLDDHSAAVTSVKLTCDGCKVLSCSADRSLVFRDVAITNTGCKTSRCHHQVASNGTIYDMAMDPATEIAVTVGQDKKINTFSISTGKLLKTFKQDRDFGEPIKVSMDPSSSYLVCSYSNKSMCIYDFTNGELVTQVVGHAEVITGVIFLPDCKHIISVGGDGCIFMWKLPSVVSSRMLQTMTEHEGPLLPTNMPQEEVVDGSLLQKQVGPPFSFDHDRRQTLVEEASQFRFSISRLPSWAQTKVTTKEILPSHRESTSCEDIDLGGSEMCPNNVSRVSCDSDTSNSPVPHDIPSFAMDKRWLTIHTVYHDLLGSPQRRNSEDATESVSSPTLLDNSAFDGPHKDEGMEIKCLDPTITDQDSLKSSCGHNDHIVSAPHFAISNGKFSNSIGDNMGEIKDLNDPQFRISNEQARDSIAGNVSEKNVLNDSQSLISNGQNRDRIVGNTCENNDTNGLCEASAEERHSDPNETSTDEEADKSNQDDDLFSKHFSNLSSAFKIEGRGTSARRSYSARFVVHRDHLTGRKRLFETSHPSSGRKLFNCSDVVPLASYDQMSQALEESQPSDAHKQNVQNFTETLSSAVCSLQPSDPGNCMSISPMTVEGTNQKGHRCISEETEIEKRIAECKEALLKLDAAAGNALELCSGLKSMTNREGTSCQPGIEFNDLAANLLPVIKAKLQSLGDMVQSTSSCSSSNTEDSRLEPLVEKFAERLSRQVLELVRKNL